MSSGTRPRVRGSGASHFRVLESLGQGGMGEVQLVLQTTPAGVERLAVMKRPRPELAAQSELADMFWEEARIAATLSHPNVVQTYEVGEDDAGYFLLLEYLRGQSYADVLTRDRYRDYGFSLEVLLGVLHALEYAHQLKHPSGREMLLVHRDISPPNVFVTYEGHVKVLDFGIAKARDSSLKTDAGVVKGKVAYMAPEQMLGAALDQRVDLYAAGVMLWEASAGQQRFVGVPDVGIASLVMTERAPLEPGAAARGLPALADQICRRALAHDPARRYQSAAEFHQDLLQLAELVGNRPPARAMGQLVAELFAEQRSAQEARVELELSVTSASATERRPEPSPERRTVPATKVLALENARIHSKPISDAAVRVISAPSRTPTAEGNPERAPAPTIARSKIALLVLGLVLLAAAGVKLGGAISGSKSAPIAAASASVASSAPAILVLPVASVPLASPSASATPRPTPSASSAAPPKPRRQRRVPLDLSDFGGRR